MAEYRPMYKCVTLLALIVCHMILSAEGRQLKYKEKEIKTQRKTGNEGSISFGDSASIHKDDFRPKTPGNSPGVGHKHTKDVEDVYIPSAENTAVGKKEILSPISFGDSTAVYKDDFRPTTPGNSPGVGHKHAEDVHIPSIENTVARKKEMLSPISFGDSAAVYKDDFRPTTPGNSPGVGHKRAKDVEDVHISSAENTVAGKKNILPPISFGPSTAVYKDDFRPTTPGNSPGVGHKHAEDVEDIQIASAENTVVGKKELLPTRSFGDPAIAHKEYFRPKKPGHSPGVGYKRAKDEGDVESKVLRDQHFSEVFKNGFQPPIPRQNSGVAPALSNTTAEPKA